MKKEGFLKKVLAILVIVLLGLVSFGGIYVKDKNIMKNILPDYILGMELDTNTIIKLDVEKDEDDSSENVEDESESENANVEENENGQAKENVNTLDNYKKTREVLENRLKTAEIKQFTVRLDEQSGSIVLEIPENSNQNILRNVFVVGKTEIKLVKENSENANNEDNDNEESTEQTEELIGEGKNIKKVSVSVDDSYKNYGIGSFVKLDLEFDNEFTKKMKNMKDSYVAPSSEDESVTEDKIIITIDGSTICSMSESNFLEYAINGALPLKLGEYTNDVSELNKTVDEANSIKTIIENGSLPVKYSIKYSNDIHSNINKIGIISVFAVVLAVMFVYLLFKYKLKGLLAELSIIGFGALLLIVLRYTKVQISIAAIVSIISMLIMQFIYLIQILSDKLTSKIFNKKTIDFTKMIIPLFIMSIVIAFANIIEISGFGMVIFWGVILFEIYNNIITRAILVCDKNNK